MTLDDLLAHVWARLARGAAESSDPFRLVTLATMGAKGPEARTVGLRSAVRSRNEVEVHSDLRTGKVEALRAEPRAALLAWDPAAQLQIRIAVTMRILPADETRWSRVPGAARTNYGTDPAPGRPVERPEFVTRTPDVARFAALIGDVRSFDVVSLAHDPHRRAMFDETGGRWVAP